MWHADVTKSPRWSSSQFYVLPLLAVLALGILCAVPSVLRAEETTLPVKTDNKLMLRGGWAYVFGATANVAVGGPVLGVGTSVDFTNTLGGTPAPMPSDLMASIGSMTDMLSGYPGIGSG